MMIVKTILLTALIFIGIESILLLLGIHWSLIGELISLAVSIEISRRILNRHKDEKKVEKVEK